MSLPFYLAQINIARLRAPLDDPLVAEFVARLAEINALAEGSPGFVWRLKDEAGDATAIRVFPDERIIVNMSVWETLEQLRAYTYHSTHVTLMRRRREWFERMERAHLALWWVPAGQIPDAYEGQARLAHLDAHGETAHAFTFRTSFPPPAALAELA